jgi:hypothetical protein
VRRTLAGSIAFLAMTGTLVVLPVYASPVPEAEPVPTATEAVAMGSVEAPAPLADVQAGTTEPVAGVPDTAPTLVVSEANTSEFSLVGVTWKYDPAVTDTVVQIRVRDSSGIWGEWTQVEFEENMQDRGTDSGATLRGGTEPLWTGASTGIEAELVTRSGARPREVTLDLLTPGASAADQVLDGPEITDTANAAASMPPVHSRAQWGADESIRTWDPQYASTIKAATLHHTGGSNGYAPEDVPGILRSIYTYHAVNLGWGDIGYNVIVDRFGRLWEGRYGGLASTVVGAHAGGFNTYTFGVSMLGNHDLVAPSSATISSVADIIAWKLALYGVDPKGTVDLTSGGTDLYPAGTVASLPTIFAHRDSKKTACPGKYGYAQMGNIREMVGSRIGNYGTLTKGNVEILSITAQTVSVRGWTIDPHVLTSPAPVVVSVDGRPRTELTADVSRPDVGAAYPEAGDAHGFSGTVEIPEGKQDVCVQLQPLSTDTLPRTTCSTLTAIHPDRLKEPVGSVDAVTVSGRQVLVRGWTVDQDAQPASLDVHVYVNDGWGGSYRADKVRSDVGRAFPDAGTAHGYDLALNVAGPGTYKVCVFGINQAGGTRNTQLGCRTVVSPVANWAPIGSLDSAVVTSRTVTMSGWSLDGDAPTQALAVRVHVDGGYVGAVMANRMRTDVGRAYPGTGTSHGYAASLDLAAGRHQVCTYAVNAGYGSLNPRLGCATVSVAAAAWNPFGSLDSVTLSGRTATFRGWTIDPDIWGDPAGVHVYVDGGYVGAVSAAASRSDVADAYPKAGAEHGYSGSFTLSAGKHQVCVYALNVRQGTTNPLLGCRSVTV